MKYRYLVTAEEMKECDRYTIHELGIPQAVLMERAAIGVTEEIAKLCRGENCGIAGKKILIVAGTGNNGGDGLAVARLLADLGNRADVALIGDRNRLTGENLRQFQILEKYGMSPVSILPEAEYDIIVDALFGVGLNRELSGRYRETVQRINEMRGVKIAVDMPSGIDADTGRVHGIAVKADITVTFAFIKRGLMLYPGKRYAGRVICADIGITERSFAGKLPSMYTLDEPVSRLLPPRDPEGNKGTFGKVLLLAGSTDMAGAAILCAGSAYRAGAGMVKVITSASNREILQRTLPEAMLLTYPQQSGFSADVYAELEKSLAWADCVAAGPGLGASPAAEEILGILIDRTDKTLILDADGLNLLAKSEKLRDKLAECVGRTGREVVMTPHAGELSRLLGVQITEIKEEPVKMVSLAAEKFECIMVSKDARTIVCGMGKQMFLNTAGNSGMATAGSGDVLTGVIAALCASGMGAYESAVLGTYLHACAGDQAAARRGEAGLMASDLIEGIAAVGREEMYGYGRKSNALRARIYRS